METITKRLHISGLTPQITQKDLESRFASFGTVKALDGLGNKDGNGDPRRYAYLTIESTQGQLAKCLNSLSGTTWKGTRLRVGDAKPDFQQRIANEHASLKRAAEEANSGRSKKRKRLRGCQGAHAADMSLVTADNFRKRAGWHKTPMGRLIRPLRMRPLHPLPEPSAERTGAKLVTKKGLKERTSRKRKKIVVLTRARRRLIDPLRWGNEYLKGVVLEGGAVSAQAMGRPSAVLSVSGSSGDSADEDAEMDGTQVDRFEDQGEDTEHVATPSPPPSIARKPDVSPPERPLESTEPAESEYTHEAAKDLALLKSLFTNGTDDDDWGGRESLSDVDMDDAQARVQNVGEAAGIDFEVVPRDRRSREKGVRFAVDGLAHVEGDEVEEKAKAIHPASEEETSALHEQPPKSQSVQVQKLKDLFAPREEDAVGFSLLGSLDVDLELDDTFNFAPYDSKAASQAQSRDALATAPATPYVAPSPAARSEQIRLDPSLPLFFPVSTSSATNAGSKGGARDIFAVLRERGWDAPFVRTESADAIRERWRSCKVELTREWKRRHREAVKSARRRGGKE